MKYIYLNSCDDAYCIKCNSKNVKLDGSISNAHFICLDCTYIFSSNIFKIKKINSEK